MINQLKDVFRSLQENEVKYVVIGGIASILYGVPRTTFDLDILIKADLDNVRKLLKALEEAGIGTALLTTPEQILENEITIFKDRVRIDVQTSTPGLKFSEAWNNKNDFDFQGQIFSMVSKDDLISSKLAAGREKDLEDVRILKINDNEKE